MKKACQIYLRITIYGEGTELSIKRGIDPVYWDKTKGCAKNNSPVAKEINSKLDQVRAQIYQHERDMIDRNKNIRAQAPEDAYLNANDEGNRMLLKVNEDHNEDFKSKINKGIPPVHKKDM